ncbi:MAG: class I SAM-dependent methyltransferase [Planctomycetota bacterium]|jgi:2-polyprenyl-3-methyl-5-hydroxy-6-metoxy-1,4-benzoquinol methylase
MTTTTEPLATTVDYFESVYAEAAGDASRIPWASRQPSPALVNWLNAVAPSLIRCGARVAIVGCGLGADAREVIRRGYEVIAFDCSQTAIGWARRLDPDHSDRYVQADLFDPPGRWVHRFDLVIDINNLQVLQPSLHQDAMTALSRLVAPHGHMLVICRGADQLPGAGTGAPWPLTETEIVQTASEAGMAPQGAVCCFTDDQDVPRIRAIFKRA